MTVYGRLSRLTSNPNPRQYVSVKPLFDPSKPMRFCEYGSHWCTEEAPDPKKLGCPAHRSAKWRNKYTSTNKGAVITERWCSGCGAFRLRELFTIRPSKRADITADCNDCRARQAPVVKPVKEPLRRCTKCDIRYPSSEFVLYIGKSGYEERGERCSRCYTGPRPATKHDPERDARLIQQVAEGTTQRIVAQNNGVSRNYLLRLLSEHRKQAAA